MIEFRKMMDREKSVRPAKGRQRDVRSGALTMRGLSVLKQSQESAEKNQAALDSQAAVEKRKELYTQLAEYLHLVFSFVQADQRFSLEPGLEIIEKIVDTRTPIDALFLKAIHDGDAYDLKISPSVNVAIYAVKMAENLGFAKSRQVEIGMAGLLHDIGMANIPKDLIYKQTLTDAEFSIFKERPQYGYDILQAFNKEYPYLAECARQVHERVDGSGYPLGLKADEIHEYAQIIGLVDVYEALIHPRPQREKILHFYAVKEIIKTGKEKYQHRYLKALLNTFSIFPLKSYVRLNSGAIGRVARTYPEQPMRPKVQIIYDSQSKRVLTQRFINLPEHSLLYIVDAASDQELVNLSKASSTEGKSGRSSSELKTTEAEPGQPMQTGYPVEAEPVRRTRTQAAKPDTTLLKKLLLVLATLFFVAGVAWHFLAENSVKKTEQGTVVEVIRVPEKSTTMPPAKKAAQTERAKPHVATTQIQSVGPEGMVTEKPVIAETRNPVELTKQTMARSEGAGKSAQKPTTILSEAIETASVPGQPSNSENRLSAENQTQKLGPPEPGRYPYSILAASHRRLSDAKKTIAILKAKGLESFWVKMDMDGSGVWYGVFSGYYADSKAARAAITKHKLRGALPKPTRYANWVGAFPDRQNLEKSVADLSDLGFSSYAVADGVDIDQLYVGAFQTRAGAADQAGSLKRAGIASIIVER